MIRERLAPAKVNLYLHVGPVQPDGYHPVETLMVFADVGDRLRLEEDGAGFSLQGPFAGPLRAESDNLVTRARVLFRSAFGGAEAALTLVKRLPIAAGLGGGSSDAAAALHLLAERQGVRTDHPRLLEIAGQLGADVPACLVAAPVIGRGRGDVLSPAPTLPRLPAVLVNPAVACPTGPVYRAFDAEGLDRVLEAPDPGLLTGPAEVASWLARTRNDLERAAIEVAPMVHEALEALAREPQTLFARMSGSGATVFALCEDSAGAERLAQSLRRSRPGWWVEPCTLGAPIA